MSSPRLVLTLPGVPAAASEVRTVLRGWLAARSCSQGAIEALELLATEVVANAVRHTASDVLSVTAEGRDDVVRIEVQDSSPTPPRPPPAAVPTHQPSGRGLWLVQRISDAWGWDPVPGGKRVWFELTCVVVPRARPS